MWAHTPFFERMPDFLRIPNLIPLHAWLIEAGTNDVATEPLFDGFCGRLTAAGVPIARGFLSVAGLHPLWRAHSLTWNYGRAVEVTDFGHEILATAVWQTSPFRHMLETKTRRLHRRLVGDDAVLDFDVLREFRAAGMSEWLALMYGFGWSAALPATNQFGVVLSWTTSAAVGRGNGWSALELAAIEELSWRWRSRALVHLSQRATCSRPISAAMRPTASVRDKCSAAQSAASLLPFSTPTCAVLPTSPRRQRPRR